MLQVQNCQVQQSAACHIKHAVSVHKIAPVGCGALLYFEMSISNILQQERGCLSTEV
jgi:hypothetical protein